MVFCVPFCTTIAPGTDVHVPSATAPALAPVPLPGRSPSAGAQRPQLSAAAQFLKPAIKNHDEQSVRKGVAFSTPSGYIDVPPLDTQATVPAAFAVAPRSFRRSLADPDVLAASGAPSRPTTGNTCRTLSGASAVSRAQRSEYGDDFDDSVVDDMDGREWSDADLAGYATSRTATGTTVRSARSAAPASASAAAAGGGKGGKKLKGHRGTWSRKVLAALHLVPGDDGRERLPSVMVYTQRRPPLAARTVGQRWWTKVKGWAVSVGGRAAGGDKLLAASGAKGVGGGRRIRVRGGGGGGGGVDSFADRDDTAHGPGGYGFMASASCGEEGMGMAAAAALDTSVHMGLGDVHGMGLFAARHNPDLDMSHHPSVSTVAVDPSHRGGRPSFPTPDASAHGGRRGILRGVDRSPDRSAHGGGVGGSRIARAPPPHVPMEAAAPPRIVKGGGGSGGYGCARPGSPSLDASAHGGGGRAPPLPQQPDEGALTSPFSVGGGGGGAMHLVSEYEDVSHHRGTVMLYDGSQHHQAVMAAMAAGGGGGGGSLHDSSRRRASPVAPAAGAAPAPADGSSHRRSGCGGGGSVPRVVSARHHSLAMYDNSSPPTVTEGGISIRSGAREPTVHGGSLYSRHSAQGPPSPPMAPALAFGRGRAISSDGPTPEPAAIVGGAWHGTPFGGGQAAAARGGAALRAEELERELSAEEEREQALALTRTPTEELRRCSVGDTLSVARLPPLRPPPPPYVSGGGGGGRGGGGGQPVAEDSERTHSYYLPGSTCRLALWSQL